LTLEPERETASCVPSPEPAASFLLLLSALGDCVDGEAPARQMAEHDTAGEGVGAGGVPTGRLPEGATYDFGGIRGGEVDVSGAYLNGRPDAPVTVATFGDFQCVFCARSERATAGARAQLLEEGTIRVLYLDFPLPIHARGRPAAEFARCVGRIEGGRGFWESYRRLHRTQDRWTGAGKVEDGLRVVAREVGAEWPTVASCMDTDAEVPTIERFQRLGGRVGVRATPTRFFNGVPRVGAITGAQFRRMVDAVRSGQG
jgi:protein-disulfide isomerase